MAHETRLLQSVQDPGPFRHRLLSGIDFNAEKPSRQNGKGPESFSLGAPSGSWRFDEGEHCMPSTLYPDLSTSPAPLFSSLCFKIIFHPRPRPWEARSFRLDKDEALDRSTFSRRWSITARWRS